MQMRRSENDRSRIHQTRTALRKAGLSFRFDPRRGKGSHGALYVGQRRTIVKLGELKPGTFHGMLKQLQISVEDF